MRRFTIWIIILLLSLVSLGNDKSIEISDRTLVHAVGIDNDDSGCTVTLQIFKSDGAGSDTQIDPSQTNTRVISNTADTFNEAMSLCENQLGNYLFIGHNQAIVLGRNTDLSDIEELLSYFIRNKDNFLGVNVVLAENTAKEILNVQIPTGTITMENFTEIVKMYHDKGRAVPSTMVKVINDSKNLDKALTLPVVSIKEEQNSSSQGSEGQQSSEQQSGSESSSGSSGGGQSSGQSSEASLISIDKNAVIKNGKIVYEMDPVQTQCANFINNYTEYGMITVDFNDNPIGVMLKKQKYKSSISLKDNKIYYNVDISLLGTTENSNFSHKDKDKIAAEIEKKFKKQCEDTFNTVFFEYDSDVFDLSRLIRHHYPKLYLDYSNNFEVLKDNTVFNVNVKCIAK